VFHDYRAAGITRDRLEDWVRGAGWESLLNRAGTTFRKLPEADRADMTEEKAIRLMLAQPSLIKRPVLEIGEKLLVGFKPAEYAMVTSRS
jgi:arsenate reductase